MPPTHQYQLQLDWTGNLGTGTSAYRAYTRDYQIQIATKPILYGSADHAFRGDPTRYNPEELLLGALSSCHLLWFLHLCAEAKVIVTAYTDLPVATMREGADGSGQFTEAILRPRVTVAESPMISQLEALHQRANQMCFIARSVNFPVRHEASATIA
ncbi:MAG: OsmC family peroxiredoxin [Bacteroidetes bacterium]|nr:MAG: OsmC family peroxiredoxin [Bacteroidota bacterium]